MLGLRFLYLTRSELVIESLQMGQVRGPHWNNMDIDEFFSTWTLSLSPLYCVGKCSLPFFLDEQILK